MSIPTPNIVVHTPIHPGGYRFDFAGEMPQIGHLITIDSWAHPVERIEWRPAPYPTRHLEPHLFLGDAVDTPEGSLHRRTAARLREIATRLVTR